MKYDCIIITGNVGTGKTAHANELMKKLSSWRYVGIHEIRKKNGDGTMEKERECQEIFRKELEEQYEK